MRKNTIDQSSFEGLPKEERRKLISDSGALEDRRFLLSRDSQIKEQLRSLRNKVEELSITYPEIVGLTLHGSAVKGYANSNSDVDGYLFIDGDKVEKTPSPKDPSKQVLDLKHMAEMTREVGKEFESVLGVDKMRIVGYVMISKDKIAKSSQEGANDPILLALFHLATNRNINEYRKIVISTLEKMGEQGEEIWKYLMNSLWESENIGLDQKLAIRRKKLYPATLKDGRRYFLQEEVAI